MSLWMSPIRIILFFSCSFISREVNTADRRLWSRVFIHLFSSLLSGLMKWLIDSNNMLGGEGREKKKKTGGGTCGVKSFCQDTHISPYLHMWFETLLDVKNRSVVKIAKTPRAKESTGCLISAGWFRYVRKTRIADENVRLCNCL